MNWQYLKLLWDDTLIQNLYNDISVLEEQKDLCITDLKEAKKIIDDLIKENDILRALSNQEETIIDIDDERISTGTKEIDKKSPHSSFSRRKLLQISKNMLAADKRLYVIQLAGDTNSMEPDIDDHTILIFERYDDVAKTVPLSEQDIVQYKHPQYSGYFVHRIREIKNGKYHIKGDNNRYYDGWFDDTVIKGRYVGKLIGKEMDGETND